MLLCLLPLLLPQCGQAKVIIRYDVKGINGDAQQNVLSALQATKPVDNSTEQVDRLFFNNQTIVQEALKPYGYFFATISGHPEKTSDKQWLFHYIIHPGLAVHVTQINISLTGPGAQMPKFIHWKKHFSVHLGSIFNGDKYDKAKQSFFALANRLGYIKATLLNHKVKINLNNFTASINLKYDTGTRYYYGAISFSKVGINNSLLTRYLQLKTAQPYSITKLLKAQQNLSNSGYFSDVTITQKKPDSSNHIPLQFELKKLKAMQYLVGAGYGTDTGYRGQLGWNWRLINAQGQHLQTSYNISQIGNSFSSTYFIPGNNPINQQYSLSTNIANYNSEAGKSNLQRYGALYTDNRNRWQITYGASFQSEKFTVKDELPQAVHLLMPTATWLYLYTNNPLQPKYGVRVSLNMRGADKNALSDLSFAQFQLRFKNLTPLNENNRIFMRADVGATYTNNDTLLPLSLRFTAGGTQSIRGYAYQSLGPAKDLLTGSIEYQYRIHGNWYAGYFQDAGNAFDDFSEMDIQRSQGIAAVWQSPIGVMELTFAKSLSNTTLDPMVQFSMGGLI